MNVPEPEPIVSVIVACRNEAGTISLLLDSLDGQDMRGIPWEIIFADGMSTDGTREVLQRFSNSHRNVRVVDNPRQIVSTGLNAALACSRGTVILRMDAHTEYAPDYIRRCLETLLSTGADNVGGPVRSRPNTYIERAISAAFHSPLSTGGAKFHNPDFEGYVDTVPYGCWHRSVFERLGEFDPALVRNQDDEFNLRITLSGGRIWQSPAIRSWYCPRSNLKNLFRQYFQYGYWKLAVMRKSRAVASWRHLAPAACLLGGVLLPVLGLVLHPLGQAAGHILLSAWEILSGLYVSLQALGSGLAARKFGWMLMPILPLVFFVYHLAYGAGSLVGLFGAFFPIPEKARGALAQLSR